MQQGPVRPPQQGLLVAQAGGGCLPTPRVLDFLCFDTPRSVLGEGSGDEDLPFYLADPGGLEEHVRQVRPGVRLGVLRRWWVLLAAVRQPGQVASAAHACAHMHPLLYFITPDHPPAGRHAMPGAVGGRRGAGRGRRHAAGALPPGRRPAARRPGRQAAAPAAGEAAGRRRRQREAGRRQRTAGRRQRARLPRLHLSPAPHAAVPAGGRPVPQAGAAARGAAQRHGGAAPPAGRLGAAWQCDRHAPAAGVGSVPGWPRLSLAAAAAVQLASHHAWPTVVCSNFCAPPPVPAGRAAGAGRGGRRGAAADHRARLCARLPGAARGARARLRHAQPLPAVGEQPGGGAGGAAPRDGPAGALPHSLARQAGRPGRRQRDQQPRPAGRLPVAGQAAAAGGCQPRGRAAAGGGPGAAVQLGAAARRAGHPVDRGGQPAALCRGAGPGCHGGPSDGSCHGAAQPQHGHVRTAAVAHGGGDQPAGCRAAGVLCRRPPRVHPGRAAAAELRQPAAALPPAGGAAAAAGCAGRGHAAGSGHHDR